MFKKSRIKIVAAIMSILVLLWAATLSIIYASSYFEMKKHNQKMLKEYADMYVLPPTENSMALPDPSLPDPGSHGMNPDLKHSPMFQLSIFYSVAVSYDGKILEIKNDLPAVHTDDDLETLAKSILKKSETTGSRHNLTFYQTDKNGYFLIVFMDNTVVNENAMTLFRYTLIFGGIALILFFILSVFLARKIVNPLEESYLKQKQFISDAGHELKTPVSVISTNAELLARTIGENQWLSNIQCENERMGMLVSQLLELARAEQATLQMERIDFSRLVAGETLPFESVAFDKGLVLKSTIAEGIILEGNRTSLRQIVSILIENAICHSSSPCEINLKLEQEHKTAKLSVSNKGRPIPRKQQEQLFERFYRVDSVRNGEEKHYGLGLAIAKAIAISHKGRIEIYCYDGLIEFCVYLPTL